LPEISFPWNLLGYPAAANLVLVQLTTITESTGYRSCGEFQCAASHGRARRTADTGRRIRYAAAATAILLIPHWLARAWCHRRKPIISARRAAQFSEVESFPRIGFQAHAAELDEISRLSLAPAAEKPDLLVWPESPAPFSFQDSQFAKIASTLAIRSGTHSLQEPSNGNHRWTIRRGAPRQSCALQHALLIDAQGSAYSYTTKSISSVR